MNTKFWTLSHLSDSELLSSLERGIGSARRALALIVAHLAEVEDRRLHLKAGFSSLFDYCLNRLGFSEGEAFRRITAARLARRFPIVFEFIANGTMHLSALCLLGKHLTFENHEQLLRDATHKSKRAVEELLAARFPRPDAPAILRKLPAPRQQTAPSRVTNDHAANPHEVQVATTTLDSELKPRAVAVAGPMQATRRSFATPACEQPRVRVPSPADRLQMEPTSAARYRVQFTATSELKEKLVLALDLTSHSNPDRDVSNVIERALDLLVAQLERDRLGTRARRCRTTAAPQPSSPRAAGKPEPPERDPAGAQPEPVPISTVAERDATSSMPSLARRSRHIPNATRRDVFTRDGVRCTYEDGAGQRCTSRAFLELHHETAFARGGPSTSSNLRVLCGAHNRFLAELEFGRAHVQRSRLPRRAGGEPASDFGARPREA